MKMRAWFKSPKVIMVGIGTVLLMAVIVVIATKLKEQGVLHYGESQAARSQKGTQLQSESKPDMSTAAGRLANFSTQLTAETNPTKLTQIFQNRKSDMLTLMRDDPLKSIVYALTPMQRKQTGGVAQSLAETESTVEGVFTIGHTDNFAAKTAQYTYSLKTTNGQILSVYFTPGNPIPVSGSTVRLKGLLLQDSLVPFPTANAAVVLRSPSLPSKRETKQTSSATSAKKVGVILFNFQNNTSQPFTGENVRKAIFTDPDSVSAFFKEVSFNAHPGFTGKLSPNGDVFGWYTIPYADGNCDLTAWTIAARNKAQAAGVDLNGYDKWVYAYPSPMAISLCADARGTVGAGPNGYEEVWINGSIGKNILVHEFGHNAGAGHASAYSCFDSNNVRTTISGNCQHQEYGDPFDNMGYGIMKHLNAHHKLASTWLAPSQTQTLQAPGCTAQLTPIETNAAGSKRLLVPRDRRSDGSVENYFEMEYRQPFGFDNFHPSDPVVNGVSIRLDRSLQLIGSNSFLLDTTPGTPSHVDGPLVRNNTFTDTERGITITTTSADATKAAVQVAYTPCVERQPTFKVLQEGQANAAPGDTLRYILEIVNNDTFTCNNSMFSLTPQLPGNDWSYATAMNSFSPSFYPGTRQVVILDITSSSTAATNLYNIPIRLSHGSFTSEALVHFNVYSSCTRFPPTVTASMSGTAGRPGEPTSYAIVLENNDTSNCPQTTFSVLATLPVGWTQDPIPNNGVLRPQGGGQFPLSITSPSSIATGLYTFPVVVKNVDDPSVTKTVTITYLGVYPSRVPLPFDINDDGREDYKDATLISRVAAGEIACPKPVAVCDVSGNGQVAAYDAALLARNLVTQYDLNLDLEFTSADVAKIVQVLDGSVLCPVNKVCDTNNNGELDVFDPSVFSEILGTFPNP